MTPTAAVADPGAVPSGDFLDELMEEGARRDPAFPTKVAAALRRRRAARNPAAREAAIRAADIATRRLATGRGALP